MNFEQIQSALYKVEPGLKKYRSIMSQINETDVSKDTMFQKEYNGFYRMRQRQPEYYTEYFNYMEKHKKQGVSYNNVLKHFYDKFGRIEASFSSKLIASINPDMPVWDEFVLKNLQLKKSILSHSNENNINIYQEMKIPY